MQQVSLPVDLCTKKTRKQVFLEEMDQVVPWSELVRRIAPYYPQGTRVRHQIANLPHF